MHFPLFGERKQMGNFSQKVDKFIDIFLNQNGYVKVVQGLQNTLLIAITGLIIGIAAGAAVIVVLIVVIAVVRKKGKSKS